MDKELKLPEVIKTRFLLDLRGLSKSDDKEGDMFKLLAKIVGVTEDEILDADIGITAPLIAELMARMEAAMESLPKAKSAS